MPRFKYNSTKYKQWRDYVYHRDFFHCQLCGTGGKINAHHIKRKVDFPSLVYNKNNGITLCEDCHSVVTGRETIFESLFTKIVSKKLSLAFIQLFFSNLATNYPSIIHEFKTLDKWLVIPVVLVKKIKQAQTKLKR